MGEHPPGAAGAQHVTDGVYDLAPRILDRTPTRFGWGQQWLQQPPLSITEVAGISRSFHVPTLRPTSSFPPAYTHPTYILFRHPLRLNNAGFEETCRLEDFDWSASITLDRRLLDAVFSLEFLDKHEHVLLVGPAGIGKSFMAQALGYSAVRAGHTVRFSHADGFFKALAQARVDNSVDRTFRSFLSPDLLILDDMGLHRLTAQQSADLYELILNRHRSSSFIITSNRAVDEWLSLFDDPILGNSALDRLANASYQIVIEGASYRERLSPHRALLGAHGGD